MNATTSAPTNVIRSRFPGYRWRDVSFLAGVARVDDRTLEAMQRDPRFGEGRQFWLESTRGVNAAEQASPDLKLTGGEQTGEKQPSAGSGDPDAGKGKKPEIIIPDKSTIAAMLDGALELEVVTRDTGGHFRFLDQSLGQRNEAVIDRIAGDQELFELFADAINEARQELTQQDD